MRISDWSSDVYSSDLDGGLAVLAADAGLLHAAEGHGDGCHVVGVDPAGAGLEPSHHAVAAREVAGEDAGRQPEGRGVGACDRFVLVRSEEHTSELQSLMRTSYAVFCLKTKTTQI